MKNQYYLAHYHFNVEKNANKKFLIIKNGKNMKFKTHDYDTLWTSRNVFIVESNIVGKFKSITSNKTDTNVQCL